MATSKATTVDAYVDELADDRRAAITAVRDVINANLPDGYEEGMQYGMPCWYVPLARYPDTYNGQPLGIAALASQKGYMAVYLNGVYADPAVEKWFRSAYAASGKKLDMGKSCVRFKTLDALPLDVIGQTIAKISVDDLLASYEAAQSKTTKKKPNAREVRAKRVVAAKKGKPKKAKPKVKAKAKKRR
jgi:uncharacterized protein YdhG (YjbR/CyaY superfamily)